MTVKIKPLENYVLISLDEDIEQGESDDLGLIMSHKPEPECGVIKELGDSCTMTKLGDIVYFAKFSGEAIERDNKKYLFLKEYDILAILRK